MAKKRDQGFIKPGARAEGELVPKLNRIRAGEVSKNVFVSLGFKRAQEESYRRLNIGDKVTALLERDLIYKPDVSGDIPQYIRTLIELTKAGGLGGVEAHSQSNFSILLNSLIQLQKATMQAIVENSTVAMGYDKNLKDVDNSTNNFLLRVMRGFGQRIEQGNADAIGFAVKSQTQSNIKKAIDFITESSETVSLQVKVIAMNNPALMDPRLTKDGVEGLAKVKPGAPLMGSLVVGADGSLRLGVHSSIFAQFAIDNDGDVVQLMVQKLKGKTLLESAYTGWFQKSPNLRHQGGIRLLNRDMHNAVQEARKTGADTVRDALTGRVLKTAHAEAAISQERLIDLQFSGRQNKVFGFSAKSPLDSPFSITESELERFANRIDTPEKFREASLKTKVKDGFTILDLAGSGSHEAYKEADLDSLVGHILNPNNKSYATERAEFIDQLNLLEKTRLDPKGNLGAVSTTTSRSRLLANTWFNWQITKSLPQIKGTKDIGMLTNSTIVYELFKTARELHSKTDWSDLDLEKARDLQELAARDTDSLVALRAFAHRFEQGQNMDDHRFRILEVLGLKASTGGKMASTRDAFGDEAPRQLMEELSAMAFKIDEDAGNTGWGTIAAQAAIIRNSYSERVHDSFGNLTFAMTKALQKPGTTLDDIFPLMHEKKAKAPGTAEEMLEKYQSAGKRHNLTFKRPNLDAQSSPKNLFQRLLDLGIYQFRSLNVDIDTIGESNDKFFKGTFALVSQDAAGNIRSAGLQSGVLGYNQVEDEMILRLKQLETTLFGTFYGVNYVSGQGLSSNPEVQAINPTDLVAWNMDQEEMGVSIDITTGKKNEVQRFNFLLGDFTGGQPKNQKDKKIKGITMDLFEGEKWETTGKHIVRNALGGLTDKSDSGNPMLRGFVGDDRVTDNDLMTAAVNKIKNMLDSGDKIGAQRVMTLGFSRRAGGIKDIQTAEALLSSISQEVGHTGEVLVGPGRSASFLNEAAKTVHGRTISIGNLNGPVQDDAEFLMLVNALRMTGISLENAFKDSSRAGGAIRGFLSPFANTGNEFLGVPEKRFSKSANQVVRSVETNSRLMYFSSKVFDIDIEDPELKKAFEKMAGSSKNREAVFESWRQFFFDPDGWQEKGVENNLEKAPGQANSIVFLGQQEKMKEKSKGFTMYQEYAYNERPSKNDLETGRAVYREGDRKYYRVLTSDDLSPDAKIITRAGDIKIVPQTSTQRAMVKLNNPLTVGGQRVTELEADIALNMGEAGAKLDHPFVVMWLQGQANNNWSNEEILSRLQSAWGRIKKAKTKREKEQIWESTLSDFGLERGVFTRDGKENEVLIAREANYKVNPIINPAEHNASKIDANGNVIQGPVAQMKSGGNISAAESARKLYAEGSTTALAAVYKHGTGVEGGYDALIEDIMRDNPQIKTPEEAIKVIEQAFASKGQEELTETAQRQIGELQAQFRSVMELNTALFEMAAGTSMGREMRDRTLEEARETKKLIKQHGHLLGGDEAARVLSGRITLAEDDITSKDPGNMYNMLKGLTSSQKSVATAGATLAASAALLSRSRHEAKKRRARTR